MNQEEMEEAIRKSPVAIIDIVSECTSRRDDLDWCTEIVRKGMFENIISFEYINKRFLTHKKNAEWFKELLGEKVKESGCVLYIGNSQVEFILNSENEDWYKGLAEKAIAVSCSALEDVNLVLILREQNIRWYQELVETEILKDPDAVKYAVKDFVFDSRYFNSFKEVLKCMICEERDIGAPLIVLEYISHEHERFDIQEKSLDWYKEIVELAVQKHRNALFMVNRELIAIKEHADWYKRVVEASIEAEPGSIENIDPEFAIREENQTWFIELAKQRIPKVGSLYFLNYQFKKCVPEENYAEIYKQITFDCVKRAPFLLNKIKKEFISCPENSEWYKKLSEVAVERNCYAFEYVDQSFSSIEENREWYENLKKISGETDFNKEQLVESIAHDRAKKLDEKIIEAIESL